MSVTNRELLDLKQAAQAKRKAAEEKHERVLKAIAEGLRTDAICERFRCSNALVARLRKVAAERGLSWRASI